MDRAARPAADCSTVHRDLLVRAADAAAVYRAGRDAEARLRLCRVAGGRVCGRRGSARGDAMVYCEMNSPLRW